MQAEMDHAQILSAAGEVVEVVLRHTRRFVEAVNVLNAAKAAIAGGVKNDSWQKVDQLSASE